MPYTAEIGRDNPTFFLFMVDQSRSMKEESNAGDGTQQKAVGVADTINRWLQELAVKCAKIDGVRDYYSIGVIGYGKSVGPALGGKLAGRDLVPMSEIADNPARLEERAKKVPDGAGGFVEQTVKVPVWFDPVANGATPMCRAAGEAHRILKEWLDDHADCFPPIVINVTDGEATDGEPTARMVGLRNLSSSDGNVMLFNVHLSANPDATPIIFPDSADDLPDSYARMLFETASPLTQTMRAVAKENGIPTSKGSKAFVLNADMVLLVQAINIGTRPASLNVESLSPSAAESDQRSAAFGGDRDNAATDDRLFAAAVGSDDGGDDVNADDEMTVVLTVEATGEVIKTSSNFDESGRIVSVIPALPLDPLTEYRLQAVPVSSLER